MFKSLIIPRTSVTNLHGNARANRFCAKVEGGQTGNDFCIGERANITHNGFVSGDFAGLDHFVEFHAGNDACKVTAFIDSGESVLIVGKVYLGVRFGSGCMAELNVREFLRSADHVRFMAKAVGKDNFATLVLGKVFCSLVASFVFFNVADNDCVLGRNAHSGCGSLESVNEVFVVGGVLIVERDQTDFEIGGNGHFAGDRFSGEQLCAFTESFGGSFAGSESGEAAQNHQECQREGKDLFEH